jgi:uncharacterized protein YcbK (DUF882 family)
MRRSARLVPRVSIVCVALACASAALAAPTGKPTMIAKAQPVTAPKPGYGAIVKTWHTPAPGASAPVDGQGRPKLVLTTLTGADRVEVEAQSERGGFGAFDLDRSSRVLREPGSGNQHPIEPRLLDVVYRIQTHFKASEIRVVSGYRTARAGNASNHGKGRAIDLVVPGATDDEVAKFARELGFVGVGIYPVSGFVHVDVRDRSYFWVDSSGPGKRNRERGILGDLAQKSDAAAAARGEHATGALTLGWDVDAARALAWKAAQPAPQQLDDDDDEEP